MTKHIIRTVPKSSQRTLVFFCQRSLWNYVGDWLWLSEENGAVNITVNSVDRCLLLRWSNDCDLQWAAIQFGIVNVVQENPSCAIGRRLLQTDRRNTTHKNHELHDEAVIRLKQETFYIILHNILLNFSVLRQQWWIVELKFQVHWCIKLALRSLSTT